VKTVILLLAFATFAFADLGAGENKTVGPYLLDVGWDPAHPVAGEKTSLAINVVDAQTLEKTTFSGAWLRISKGEKIFFAGNLQMDEGSTALTFVFPEEGEWTLDVQFAEYKEKTTVKVQPKQVGENFVFAIVGILLVVFALVLFKRKRASV